MTKRRFDAAQMAFDWGSPATKLPEVAPRSPIARLIEGGLPPYAYLPDISQSLEAYPDTLVDRPWSLPSRAFRFPIRIHRPLDDHDHDPPECLYLTHSSLREHPFVRRVAEILGSMPEVRPHDAWRIRYGDWHHAIDLMDDDHWEDLLRTREYTTPEAIANAVAAAMEFGDLTLRNARAVMSGLGSAEPDGRSRGPLMGDGLLPARQRGGSWAINVRSADGPVRAWMLIHGVEDGWFKRDREGDLTMSDEGLRRRGIEVVQRKARRRRRVSLHAAA